MCTATGLFEADYVHIFVDKTAVNLLSLVQRKDSRAHPSLRVVISLVTAIRTISIDPRFHGRLDLVPDFRQRFYCLVTLLIFMISCFWDFSQPSLCCRLVCLRNETSTHSLSRVIRRCSPNVLRSDGLAFICIET